MAILLYNNDLDGFLPTIAADGDIVNPIGVQHSSMAVVQQSLFRSILLYKTTRGVQHLNADKIILALAYVGSIEARRWIGMYRNIKIRGVQLH